MNIELASGPALQKSISDTQSIDDMSLLAASRK
jgi:hypothetical protein